MKEHEGWMISKLAELCGSFAAKWPILRVLCLQLASSGCGCSEQFVCARDVPMLSLKCAVSCLDVASSCPVSN